MLREIEVSQNNSVYSKLLMANLGKSRSPNFNTWLVCYGFLNFIFADATNGMGIENKYQRVVRGELGRKGRLQRSKIGFEHFANHGNHET